MLIFTHCNKLFALSVAPTFDSNHNAFSIAPTLDSAHCTFTVATNLPGQNISKESRHPHAVDRWVFLINILAKTWGIDIE